MTKVLACWIGDTDLSAALEDREQDLGPIAEAVEQQAFDRVCLLSCQPLDGSRKYVRWLQRRGEAQVNLQHVDSLLGRPLSSPTNFSDVYQAAVNAITKLLSEIQDQVDLTFHLTPGTPVMAAVWVILGKTRFSATLLQAGDDHDVQTASMPFDMSAEFLPDLLRKPDERLAALAAGLPPENPEFDDIVGDSRAMKEVTVKARRVAPRSVAVLIEGESGTGKELLARAIHGGSPRRDKPFLAVNCGAIPHELVESQLFGHRKGAFTGATADHPGYFEQADGGTLFLDEIGELPLAAQVKFLRVVQEGAVTRIGGTEQKKVDVRILAATNLRLKTLVQQGKFRADLFYRLAVAVLSLPRLKDRGADIGLLIDKILHDVNNEGASDPGYEKKTLSGGARKVLTGYEWPGNVRELENTLRRIAIWTPGPRIGTRDVKEALMPIEHAGAQPILGRPLGDGLDINDLLSKVARDYLERALEEARGNKTKAAKLIGLASYQTFINWMTKYGVQG